MEKNNYKEDCNTMTFEFYGFENIKGVGILDIKEDYMVFSNCIDSLLTKENRNFCCTTNYTLPIQVAEKTPGYIMFKMIWFKMFVETLFLENHIFLKDQVVWDVKMLFTSSYANLINYIDTMQYLDIRLVSIPFHIMLEDNEFMYSDTSTHVSQLSSIITAKIDEEYVKINYNYDYDNLDIKSYLTLSSSVVDRVCNNLNTIVLNIKNKIESCKVNSEEMDDTKVFPIKWNDNILKIKDNRFIVNDDSIVNDLHIAFTINKEN